MTGRPFDGAATGFVLALLQLLMEQDKAARTVIWCSPHHAGQAGHILASALPALGISPSRFIFVHDQHPKRLMGAFEEVLPQTGGILAVVGEYGLFSRNITAWQRWGRRCRLAAQTGGGIGMLLGAPAPVFRFEQAGRSPLPLVVGLREVRLVIGIGGPVGRSTDYTRQGTSCADRLRYDGLTGRVAFSISSAQHPASIYRQDPV